MKWTAYYNDGSSLVYDPQEETSTEAIDRDKMVQFVVHDDNGVAVKVLHFDPKDKNKKLVFRRTMVKGMISGTKQTFWRVGTVEYDKAGNPTINMEMVAADGSVEKDPHTVELVPCEQLN